MLRLSFLKLDALIAMSGHALLAAIAVRRHACLSTYVKDLVSKHSVRTAKPCLGVWNASETFAAIAALFKNVMPALGLYVTICIAAV